MEDANCFEDDIPFQRKEKEAEKEKILEENSKIRQNIFLV